MNRSASPPVQPLPPDLGRQVDRLCDQWEADRKAGRARPIEDYVPPAAEAIADALLRELVLLEIDYRCLEGEIPDIDDYRSRFPQLPSAWLLEALPPARPGCAATLVNSLPVAEPPAQRRWFGDYELLEELGRGGMGVVYKARQLSLNRIVALKMILAGANASAIEVARFRREAEAAASLDHPNIVPIYEVGEVQGQHFYSMKWIDGADLGHRASTVPTPRAQARLVTEMARAVHFAHQRGILHRDLKPANILLDEQGKPWVSDFGLARFLASPGRKPGESPQPGESPHSEEAGLTQTGHLLGTPSYMAPEQAAGSGKQVTTAADVYALGAILYQLLTGLPPFRAPTPLATLQQVLGEEPVPPRRGRPDCPRDLETICLKCLEKDPARRYASAADLADDLDRFLDRRPIAARPAGLGQRLGQWCRRNPVAASLLLAFFLGSAVGLWHFAHVSRQLVQASALESAAQQAEVIEEVNLMYGEAAERARLQKVPVRADYAHRQDAIPVPATFTIDLGKQLTRKSASGMEVRLYSEYPFRTRTDGGPQDDFEWEALRWLQDNPDQSFHRFEDYQGRPVLRYAVARRMQRACVECHNRHPDRPRKVEDWREGDVRGVLEIIRPLDSDDARVRAGLRGSFVLMAVVVGSLLGLSGLAVLVRNRRGRN